MLAREYPDISCEPYFDKIEWQLVYTVINKKTPVTPPTLKEMITYVAQLGGHLARKNDGPPGVKTMWLGLRDLAKLALGAEVFQKIKNE